MAKDYQAYRSLERQAEFRRLNAEMDKLKSQRENLIRLGREHRQVSDRMHELGWEIRNFWEDRR
jgi:hypothetical protein